MSPLIRIQCDRTYHTLVLDEIERWELAYGYSHTSTTVYLKSGTSVTMSGNHDRVVADAVTKWREHVASLRIERGDRGPTA